MTCPQLAYRRKLAPVAREEVRRAKLNGAYVVTFNMKSFCANSKKIRAGIIKQLKQGNPRTASQLSAALSSWVRSITEELEAMQKEGLVTSSRGRHKGRTFVAWRLKE